MKIGHEMLDLSYHAAGNINRCGWEGESGEGKVWGSYCLALVFFLNTIRPLEQNRSLHMHLQIRGNYHLYVMYSRTQRW